MEGGLTLQVVENGIVIIWIKKKGEEKKKSRQDFGEGVRMEATWPRLEEDSSWQGLL